jgi:phosphatidylethanolamine-binding protein (PEBP) family uncharacterized protein
VKTSRFLLAAICIVILAMFARNAAAHPGHEHNEATSTSRTWTLADSGAHLHGAFVSVKHGQTQIRRGDGKLISLSIEQLTSEDKHWIARRSAEIRRLNEQTPSDRLVVFAPDAAPTGTAPEMAKAFDPFARLKAITYRWDNRYFYVESNGMPDHPMMVGITAWQQQVPLPQRYVGNNAWQIPLHPVPARQPATAKNHFLRGAIALAVNGIPIFNPLNNRGDDSFLFGELDEYGGHCGRADDYHYHIAPVHLEKQVGQGKIIAYALDGYPIYGYEEPDGSKVTGLDWLNGHKDADGHYHYHATKTYPYLNGGFYGEVNERGDQVDPQPRAEPVREALPPLRGAKIVGFTSARSNAYRLTYAVNGKQGTVAYTIAADGSVAFQSTDTGGKTTSENYTPSRRPPPGGKGGEDRRPKGKRDDPPPGKGKRPPPPRDNEQTFSTPKGKLPQLSVTSSAFEPGGSIPTEFTGDGSSFSPPIEWKGAPFETKFFAINVWHVPGPGDIKSYWVVYNIPATVTRLAKNDKSTGVVGVNDKSRREYDPMKSKGPGVKKYHITVYALSEELKLPAEKATRANLLAAIKDITLTEGTLDFQYERKMQK